jgi:hypothetical protein
MATAFDSDVPAQGTEERFFFKLVCAIGVVLVAGFSFQLAAGRSSFSVPLVYHLHGLVFFGWLGLLLTQSFLIASGNVALHRRLGWLSALWVPMMAVLAITITVTSLRRTGGPFFFDANEFLFGNITDALTFAAMVLAAIRMRRRTDWHRRLMIGATVAITGPGWGRLLPTPLLIPYGWEISNAIGVVFIAAGMIRDKRVNGAVHPAWFVGLAAGLGWIVVGEWIAYTPWAIDLTREIMAGHPGAVRPMEAYLP